MNDVRATAAPRQGRRAFGRLCRQFGLSAVLALTAAWPAGAAPRDPSIAAAPRAEIPARDRQALATIARQYQAAKGEADRTGAMQALAELLWTASFLPQRRQGCVTLPDELLQTMGRDLAGNVPQARMQALARVLAVLDASGRAAMAAPLLGYLRQSPTEPARAAARTALWSATRGAPEQLFQAIRDTRDERMLGDLAQVARGASLPADVRQKLDAAGAASTSPAIRVQIAQALGPGASGYDDVVRGLIAELEAAPSDEARERIIVTLGGFAKPDDAIARAMIDAVSRSRAPSRVTWRALAQAGPAGLLYLAASVKKESDAARLVDKATMLAAVAGESGPLPARIAPAVLDAAISARLRSDDPLLRSSVQALLIRSGPAAVAPIRQALDRAAPGQARDDLAAALARLEAS
ncbi:hypothetical protein ACOTEK_04005 [Achromobacter xylosoxidans]|uniref:hypothetical protein n=1 Tax=Alcaligenes xylosoxydans xylosoxydans TaxID=85698 RepID=UPI0008A118B4|nr:hypothetical protein [Achromobacter xylosoxidans]OFQ46406.1 hypothetical protein HMPREF2939_20275 [Achromobacter xylosoxidans]CUR81062.1 hypothetical protein BN2910_43890 [Achromobacter xylosoxidans]